MSGDWTELLDVILTAICHRDPARSFPIGDGSVVLCGRCTGLTLGVLAGLLVALCLKPPRTTAVFVLLASAVALTPLEAVGERLGLWGGTNSLRLIMGAATGLALPCAMITPVATGRRRPFAAVAGAGLLTGILLAGWSWPAWLGTLLLLGWLSLAVCVGWTGFKRLGRRAPANQKGEAK